MQADAGSAEAPPIAGPGVGKWGTLGLLMAVYSCHMLDRTVVNVVLEPIRMEFGLTDTQLGMLSGLAYGVAFSLASIPIGLLIDRVNRRNLLGGMLAVWSLLTAATGFVQGLTSLFLARMGVAIAEAGASPTAMSMISDLFPPERRSTALSLFLASTGIGTFLSFFFGSIVAAHFGWRSTFLLAGLPGLLLAVLIFRVLKEPVRGSADRRVPIEPQSAQPKGAALLREIVVDRRVGALIAASLLFALVAATLNAWSVSVLMRAHGLSISHAGILFSLAWGALGTCGVVLVGSVADRLAEHDPRWTLRIVRCAAGSTAVFCIGFVSAQSEALAIACLFATSFTAAATFAPLFNLIISSVHAHRRGVTMALVSALSNMIGYGGGPFITGALSSAIGGPASLQMAVAISVGGATLIAIALTFVQARAGSSVRQ
jgi:predicted MFS family arabinose efflux permease